MSAVEKKMIELRSSDGELFQVEEKAAVLSVTIKNLVDDGCSDSVIPMTNVPGKTLAKVIEYCQHHAEAVAENEGDETVRANRKELEAFDKEFLQVGRGDLFQLILAANYMNIKGLLDLTCQTVADIIKDMSVPQVRDLFQITNDFTPEEEEAIRKQHAWVHEE